MDDLLEQIFPEGEERWIKVKYLDTKKCVKNLRLASHNYKGEDLGFEVVNIGLKEDYIPILDDLLTLQQNIGNLYKSIEVAIENFKRDNS